MMRINEHDTIAAISTGAGNSGIGIVRVSGCDAVRIVNEIFTGDDLENAASHTIHYGHVVEKNSEISGGVQHTVDEVLVMLMRTPRTYTREDVVEINCHGGMYVTDRVLRLVLKNGARLAEPGEFTKRAFLNGRIDMTQAEAVIDIINSQSDYALQSAQAQLEGSISFKIRSLRGILLEHMAYIEAALDDPEHLPLDDYGTTLLPVLEDVEGEVKRLAGSFSQGRIIREGIRTVILGKPNVGKSSLMNVLAGSERAIVTDIAGTTRDVLEEKIRLGELVLNVADTAGIRQTDDVIERMGVDRARKYVENADLILFMVDASSPLSEEDQEILQLISGKNYISLLNKQDLGSVTDAEDIFAISGQEQPALRLSLKDGQNPHEAALEELSKMIYEMFLAGKVDFNDQIYVTNARHHELLESALESLERTIDCINDQMPEDLYIIDMMDAYESLGLITADTVDDDLANEIFSKFCMGK